MEARVHEIKYRPSPILSRGLEIPIILDVKKGDSSTTNFEKMENYVKSFYVEPEKNVQERTGEDRSFEDFDVKFVPECKSRKEAAGLEAQAVLETQDAPTETTLETTDKNEID